MALYRPQWVYKTPEGYRDEPWFQAIRAVDLGTIAASPPNARPGQYTTKGPFVISFDRDAEFLILGMAIDAGDNFRSLGYQFTDAFGYLLSDDFIGSDLYAMPLGQSTDRGGGFGSSVNTPHYVPPGGTWQLSVINFDNVVQTIPDMELRGYKRFKVVCE